MKPDEQRAAAFEKWWTTGYSRSAYKSGPLGQDEHAFNAGYDAGRADDRKAVLQELSDWISAEQDKWDVPADGFTDGLYEGLDKVARRIGELQKS